MKVTTNNNAELVIQANMKVMGDFDLAMLVAEEMATNDLIDIASSDEDEGWIHLCAVWDNRQAEELLDIYYTAKLTVKGG